MVYQLLNEHDLSDYYVHADTPGMSPNDATEDYSFLDQEEIISRLLDFQEDNLQKVSLHLPQIHCTSCLYLLENLNKLDAGVLQCKVNFGQRQASILYDSEKTNLRQIVRLLAKIGYEPRLNLDSLDKTKKNHLDKQLLYRLGLAGFAFGNIMLLSFPEYLGFDKASYLFHIGYINIILATPLLFYSGWGYIKSAWQGLRLGHLNLDLPIAIGMVTLYSRSVFEILSHSGEGYLDSFSGFVFFLLVGRWFQSFTYQVLDFDRNYKSYFPISTLVKEGEAWVSRVLGDLQVGDIIKLRDQQLIPADGVVSSGRARVDYSFVTGESDLVDKQVGEVVFAGGRHYGQSIEVAVSKAVDESYLTQLWNDEAFSEGRKSKTTKLVDNISRYFTYVILAIALTTLVIWWQIDASRAFSIFTAVLIVACPCALALAIPFTYGNLIRLLAQKGLYLRNTQTIEHIQDIDHIVFDKTGTITDHAEMRLRFEGSPTLTDKESALIASVCQHSSHPLSRAIVAYHQHEELYDIDRYQEHVGQGLEAVCQGRAIRLGSAAYIFGSAADGESNGVFIEIDGTYRGRYVFEHALREGISQIISDLQPNYALEVLSGDSSKESHRMRDLFGERASLRFGQSPQQKLDRIRSLQATGAKVMMVGDGLNDAGALKQSNVGLVISDQVNNFSPACDAIIDAKIFEGFYRLISCIKGTKRIIYGAFLLAFMYNVIGLGFAVTGNLSPVVAAILMPTSSITVIVYGVLSSYFYFRYKVEK